MDEQKTQPITARKRVGKRERRKAQEAAWRAAGWCPGCGSDNWRDAGNSWKKCVGCSREY